VQVSLSPHVLELLQQKTSGRLSEFLAKCDASVWRQQQRDAPSSTSSAAFSTSSFSTVKPSSIEAPSMDVSSSGSRQQQSLASSQHQRQQLQQQQRKLLSVFNPQRCIGSFRTVSGVIGSVLSEDLSLLMELSWLLESVREPEAVADTMKSMAEMTSSLLQYETSPSASATTRSRDHRRQDKRQKDSNVAIATKAGKSVKSTETQGVYSSVDKFMSKLFSHSLQRHAHSDATQGT
jgi:hypothetical protein